MNLSTSFVVNVMFAPIVDNLNYEFRSIIRAMEERYRYTISYDKAFRAKRKVTEVMFGMYEASYDNLIQLLHTITQRNPRTYFDTKHNSSVKEPGKLVLQCTCFALGAFERSSIVIISFASTRPSLLVSTRVRY